MSNASTSTHHSISHLPFPPKLLQHTLHRIPLSPLPSYQRRSQQFETGHWARVTPLPVAFPFRLPRAEKEEDQVGVEEWLGEMEPSEDDWKGPWGMRRNEKREVWEVELLGISRNVKEFLPHLDTGNAVEYVEGSVDHLDEVAKELIDVVSGKSTLVGKVNVDGEEKEYGPWSLRYAGHQFGQWAGQLGDGRAMSILETQTPDGGRQEIQLKGAGRTPFSRSADGLAVLRSGVREYLGAEAMSALGIPTTRSLTLLTHPTSHLSVLREYGPEPSSLLARVAPSFLRIGNFQILNPPEDAMNMSFLFLGGGGSTKMPKRDWEGLRVLKEWVGELLGVKEGGARELVEEVARRNAKMVAGWQVYGFCHGVINTDNVSVLGLTIDYGPYAFMDVYDPYHICNHSDGEGRYDYRKQPTMILYALKALHTSLAEMIGYEALHSKAAPSCFAEGVDEETLKSWKAKGMESWEDIERETMGLFRDEYWKLYRKRFGLAEERDGDMGKIIDPFLQLLEQHAMDFHSAFRHLCFFKPSMLEEGKVEQLNTFLNRLSSTIADEAKKQSAELDFKPWLKEYAARISSERGSWDGKAESWEDARCTEMRRWNPRFVLRQWVLEETISKLEQGEGLERRKVLDQVMQMSLHPFEPYGGELKEGEDLTPSEEIESRLCGMGDKGMLGFQCSCSS